MKNKIKYLLIFIIVLAFFLRIIALDRADIYGDEATYSFRAVGYLDYLASEQQTTPLQWFGYLPWWSKLSFHDAPPLVFIFQHIFFKFFSVSTFAARLPFAVFGVLTVYLLYLFAKKLFKSEPLALVAGLILAVLNYHIWISRTGYLEGILTFFILLSLYCFLNLLENDNWKNYFFVGLTLGLAFMCKYTMLFLIPVYFFYLLLFKKIILLNKKIIICLLTFIIIISPVIFFNLMVFKTRGHLDLQFSQALGMDTSKDWSLFAKGQNHPLNLWENFQGTLSTTSTALGRITFWFFVISLIVLIFLVLKKYPSPEKNKIYLLFLIILFFLLQFIFLGAGPRFLPIITPLVAVCLGYLAIFIYNLSSQKFYKIIIIILVLSLVIVAGWEAVNTNLAKIATLPFNPSLRQENYGFRQLENYFQKQNFDKAETLIVYDGRLNWFSRTWYFYRLVNYNDYHSVSTEYFIDKINTEGEDYFGKVKGIKNYYFIKAENSLLEPGIISDAPIKFEEFLTTEYNLQPVKIFRDDGRVAFKVYNFK